MATTISSDYSAISVIGGLSNPCSDTARFFDLSYVEDELSPLDVYIKNCNELNRLWINQSLISPEFSRLLLLGYVSAVESYFRYVFRTIINIDKMAKAAAHAYEVSYGAALFYDKSMLPEALLERYSFSGSKDIRKAFKNFLDTNVPASIDVLLDEFEIICQMRHCCVHRFGKLGSHNGIVLGLHHHMKALEKPIGLDRTSLADIASWLMSFVKTINNHLFRIILERTLNSKNADSIGWAWSFNKDKGKFYKIYSAFATNLDTLPSPSMEEMYNRFKISLSGRYGQNKKSN